MTELDELLDDIFHGAAFAAFVEEAMLAQAFPCPTKTRQRAYRYYEQALANKNATESFAGALPNEARVVRLNSLAKVVKSS